MRSKKFIHDTKTVLSFIQIYCNNKHTDNPKQDNLLKLMYQNKELHVELKSHLCTTCENTLLLCYTKLQLCPHEEKPSCRKCPQPCYEKSDWKAVARIMRYSGMKLGLNRIKKLFTTKNSN